MPTSSPRCIVDIDVGRAPAPLSRRRAQHVVETVLRAERVRDALVSVAFVSNRQIAAINRRYLGHRGATDVISLAYARLTARDSFVGDIYIAPAVARSNAREGAVSVREEIVRLLVHGTLHVLGYDHPDNGRRERSAMWKRQELLVRKSMKLIAR
jgi:probable rRNA maturation factor